MLTFLENCFYYLLSALGWFFRILPVNAALGIGKAMGLLVYYLDMKHRTLAYSNLKIAFADSKSPEQIRHMTKGLFKNFGQNIIEIFRLPLMSQGQFKKYVQIERREHVEEALKQGRGVILLAMHYGSWELASLTCAMLDHPYQVMVKPQKIFPRLEKLFNSYRSCGGSVVLSRGMGTRDLLKSLKNNEINAMVVDQGGKDGVRVPLFNRQASLSDGAIRIALKYDVPICFTLITRQKGPYHRLIIHKPFEILKTGDFEQDVITNLKKIAELMEQYIRQSPHEYTWFYKIWKYSNESKTLILNDGRTGHLRQSQAVAQSLSDALNERKISSQIQIADVLYKSQSRGLVLNLSACLIPAAVYQGRLGFLKRFLLPPVYEELIKSRFDFIISCGSSLRGLNYILSRDSQAKSVLILKPGILGFKRFDLVLLPQHDAPQPDLRNGRVVVTQGALNLITPRYLEEQKQLLLRRFTHLRLRQRLTIGLFLGGPTKRQKMAEQSVRILINQMKGTAEELNAEILATTSRRTSKGVEQLLQRELKGSGRCPLLILASRSDIPEAVGGILGLADIVVVSGDSISMVSEAASSGKNTIVFPLSGIRQRFTRPNKQQRFIEQLQAQGYILVSPVKEIGQAILYIAKNKTQTKRLDDQKIVSAAVRRIL